MKISSDYFDAVKQAQSPKDLYPVLQAAIELEHATIPPYLCAYFTLNRDTNLDVGDIIRSVAIEEMLHMTIACNLLIAIGGKPSINGKDFVPSYPGKLPMNVQEDLTVDLAKCSVDQVRDVFMKIEEPEEDLPPHVLRLMAQGEAPAHEEHGDTIGAFYDMIAAKLQFFGDQAFVGTGQQVVALKWFTNPEEMFEITDVASACRAIDVIKDQGEGSDTSPFDAEGIPSHYYRFEEIVKGRRLIHNEHPKEGEPEYSYTGAPVLLDTANIANMDKNPAISKYKPGSEAARVATQFSYSYTRLLANLHDAFNFDQSDTDAAKRALGKVDEAMGVMYELRLLAHQTLAVPAWFKGDAAASDTIMTGLSFEYTTLNT